MIDEKFRGEKVEMVKRIIRQNNYHQYEKTHSQCIALGLNVNRTALDRFANKLELIDKANMSKQQVELQKIEQLEREAEQKRKELLSQSHPSLESSSRQYKTSQAASPVEHVPLDNYDRNKQHLAPDIQPQTRQITTPVQSVVMKRVTPTERSLNEMSYEQVKQRETEITFALGELKIRENELLQELISLSELLDSKQIN